MFLLIPKLWVTCKYIDSESLILTHLILEVPGQEGHGLHYVEVIGQLSPHMTGAVGEAAQNQ